MDVCVFFRTGMLTGQLVYAMVQYLWLPGTPMVTLDLPHRMRCSRSRILLRSGT